jgi:hypothetical protein
MKHLKTFENYSVNEEEIFGGVKKFFTGHEDDESKSKAKEEFMKSVADVESQVSKDPEAYIFKKDELMKQAEENNYLGALRVQRGGRSPKIFVVYDPKATGMENLASAAGSSQPFR